MTEHDPLLKTVEVAVIGAGPAGCAAGVFCARADLETLLIENGRSTLRKCAFVENYLGFPAGIAPRNLLDLSREHAQEAGCTLREATVESARAIEDGFELTVNKGKNNITRVRATYLLAASWSESDYLDEIGVETEAEPDGPVQEIQTDETGETSVDSVYAAGRIAGTHHQALVNAGDGARVALNIVNRAIPEFYNDWVAPEGYYASYDRDVPVGVEEITHEERHRRAERGRKRMRSFFEER